MIREEELREAIAECEGARNPSASTCIKLASYYAILNQKFKPTEPASEQKKSEYSFASAPDIAFDDSEFSQIIEKKGISKCFPVLIETAEAMSVVVPRLYCGMMRKLKEI